MMDPPVFAGATPEDDGMMMLPRYRRFAGGRRRMDPPVSFHSPEDGTC